MPPSACPSSQSRELAFKHLIKETHNPPTMAKSPRDSQTTMPLPARTRRKKEPRHGRSERAIAASLRQHMSDIAETNRKANSRRELALLRSTPELRFAGDVITQPRDDAILAAREAASRPRPECAEKELVFYVDGSSFYKPGKRNAKRCAGAAVVFPADDGQVWQERVFPLPRETDAFGAEMTAIAEGLAVALSQTLTQPGGIRKVAVFSDCPGALVRLNELRQRTFSEECLRSELPVNSVLRKLITRSQYFRRLGISVELRWVPAHSGVEGNVRADRAARNAAQDDRAGPGLTKGVYLDEALHLIELEVTGKGKEERPVKAKRRQLIIPVPEDHLRLIPEVRPPTQSTSELSSSCADALPPNPTSKALRSTIPAHIPPQEVPGREAGGNTDHLQESCCPGGIRSDAA